jgi:hypothetical protein
MYENTFKALFPLLSAIGGKPIQWKHIHDTGIYAVVTDMCHKQASGM